MASSILTDIDDASSVLSSLSSKGTSPTGFDTNTMEPQQPSRPTYKRQTYDVRPRVSIPADIPHHEYARQCIAAAEASRLNPYSLHPEEYTMLRGHISHPQVTTYLNIRNGILRLWVRNPQISVMRNEAIGCAKDPRWFEIARVCHEWLVRRGYINFGCLEHQVPGKKTKRQKAATRKQRTVVVIGAGMSGLGCARQLEGLFTQFADRFHAMDEDPPKVIVLEGRDRVGGRVFSKAYATKPSEYTLSYGSRHTAEMGGMIITGFDRGNPLNILVRGQLALPYHALRTETTIYDSTGKAVDSNRDQYAEQLFNYILDRVSEYKFKLPIPRTVDGDKDAVDIGKDITGDGHRTIQAVEDSPAVVSRHTSQQKSPSAELQMIPVALDRLTGRVHLEPGVPAVHTAAFKAKEIGWLLRQGVGIERDLDLEAAVNDRWATLGSVFEEALRQFAQIIDFTPLDLRLINWHVANLEYSNAIAINRLSLGGWDLDTGNEWEGKHTMVTGGYQQVPRGILNCPQPLNVRKGSNVKKIYYSPDNIERTLIECENGSEVQADYVVSTIPLGVLKQRSQGDQLFYPPLPDWKTGPIKRIGFGVLNKVVLVYKEAFWDQSRDIFGTLRNPDNRFSLNQTEYFTQRGRFFQWFNCTSTSGMPTLLALMAGDAAFSTEKTPDQELVAEATKVLQSVFGNSVPTPVEALVTRWASDRFAKGSYSYTGPNFKPLDYEDMARPVGNLFFAGEHTCGTHPATVHGAYISGLRAASEIIDTILGPIQFPLPLILPKDGDLKRKVDAASTAINSRNARLEAYDHEIYSFIASKIGERPFPPPKCYANSFRVYTKEMSEEAKRRCELGRRPGKGKPVVNEVKKMVGTMWAAASEEEKRPYEEAAEVEKRAHAVAMADFERRFPIWEAEAIRLRSIYVVEHPSIPGPDELETSPGRSRRAKRVSGYAEDSDSEMEL